METIVTSSFNNALEAHVSTMTVFFKPSIDQIDLSIEKWNDGNLGSGKYRIRVPGSLRSKKKIFRSFYNSISLIHEVPNGLNKKNRLICAKIFKNGGVQVTGCQSEEDSKNVIIDIISNILSKTFPSKKLYISRVKQ